MKIKETRHIYADRLRALCIEHQWFTRGTCEEYDKFLSSVYRKNMTTARLQKLAETIMQYSKPETYEILDGITGIMYCLGEIAMTTFAEE